MSLELRNVTVGKRVEGISLTLAPGTVTGLIGPNGSGKSTLLQIAAGVLPASGSVRWDGRDLAGIPIMERARLAAWVPQEAYFEFGFSVRSVVSQGRYAHGDDGTGVEEALSRLDLTALASRPINQLSGGERQRAQLARALATDARLQLWDEPFAPLDPRHVLEVLALARELSRRDGAALLISLHDLALASEFDQIAMLDFGHLRAIGPPAEVLSPELLSDVFRVRATTAPRLVFELI
jgi:iron complex transport system ATP-binding protein